MRTPDGHSKERGNRGVTLVEVLAATVVFVVGLIALAQIAVGTSNVRRTDRETKLAWAALQEQLRIVESTPFQNIVSAHDGRGFGVTLPGETNAALRPLATDLDGLPGLIAVTVPSPPDDPAVLLEVTARLDWVGSFAPRSLVRTLRISRPGANP